MKNKKGFTLLELIIVIIIIGILATIGFTQYTRMVEKGRMSEARAVISTIRSAEQAYYLEYGQYTQTLSDLAANITAAGACDTNYYFSYAVTGTAAGSDVTATRCASGGKTPDSNNGCVVTTDIENGRTTLTSCPN